MRWRCNPAAKPTRSAAVTEDSRTGMRRPTMRLVRRRVSAPREPCKARLLPLQRPSGPVVAGRAAKDEGNQAEDGQADAKSARCQAEAHALPVAVEQVCHQ